jgi:hypothetical protein
MKLPVNPKTRNQLLILAGIAVLALLAMAYSGLSAIMTKRAETHAKLLDAISQLNKINREIKAIPALRQSRDDLFWTIQQAATNYILFHEYRNYHLTAREILLPVAAEMGIMIDIPKEGVIDVFPIAESKSTNKVSRLASRSKDKDNPAFSSHVFALYPVTLTGRSGFASLLAFLRRIESANPYLTVGELSVKADPKTPEEHQFAMTLLWPIWLDMELKPSIDDLISPAQEYGNASPSN